MRMSGEAERSAVLRDSSVVILAQIAIFVGAIAVNLVVTARLAGSRTGIGLTRRC